MSTWPRHPEQTLLRLSEIDPQYGALLMVDLEEEYYPEEITKLEQDVRDGLGLIVFGEWFNVDTMVKMKFFDDNTRSWWTPVTGQTLPLLISTKDSVGTAAVLGQCTPWQARSLTVLGQSPCILELQSGQHPTETSCLSHSAGAVHVSAGGANVPALNDLLRPYGIAFGDAVLEGQAALDGEQIYYASGANIVRFPAGGYLHAQSLADKSAAGSFFLGCIPFQ